MQQRVAIARALAYQPSILLMDEPFASVDAQTRADLEDLVLEVRRQYEVTIVFVTHDIDESVYLSDRVIVLDAVADAGARGARGRAAAAARPGRDEGAAGVRAPARARLADDQAPRGGGCGMGELILPRPYARDDESHPPLDYAATGRRSCGRPGARS